MKKFAAFLAAVLLTVTLSAQNFEGTISWKMKVDISDPAMQAKMQEAQAKLASPEAQAALQNPQLQEMMRQNPQMKAMLERQMAAVKNPGAASGNPFAGMLPEGFVFKTKGERSLVVIQGGMMAGEILTIADQNTAYHINRDTKTYRQTDTQLSDTATAQKFKVTRTDETQKILGYTCTRCDVEPTNPTTKEKMTYTVWVTKEIKGLDPKQFSALQVGRGRGSFMGQLDGVPLRMEIHSSRANITMDVVAITPEKLPDALFQLPAGFTESAR